MRVYDAYGNYAARESDMTNTLIAESATPRGNDICAGAVVLRHLPESSPHHPYVTHWRNDDLGGYCWGHYFDNEADARSDYNARVRRGY